MIWILGIALTTGVKTLFCKGFSLGIFLLLFWIKGRKLKFCSDEWDNFFLQMSTQSVQRYVIVIYTVSAVISSAISYIIFDWVGYEHSFGLALLLFIGGLIITAYKWNKKGKDYLLKRYQEIPQTILAQTITSRKIGWIFKNILICSEK